jgi:hypothetical protein
MQVDRKQCIALPAGRGRALALVDATTEDYRGAWDRNGSRQDGQRRQAPEQ